AWQSAVTWAIAALMSAPGWKNILITLVPRTDCDSMCSMLLTVVVSARSTIVVMRSCISFGARLPYVQITLMTGMSILGKMSTGIVTMDSTPRTAINRASTTNVYGRRRASRTIHMIDAV